jgi:hypothetical protein
MSFEDSGVSLHSSKVAPWLQLSICGVRVCHISCRVGLNGSRVSFRGSRVSPNGFRVGMVLNGSIVSFDGSRG